MISSVNVPFLNSRQARQCFENYLSTLFHLVVIACLLPTALASCSVCGENSEVGKPDVIFEYPGQPAVPCSVLQQAGVEGFIPMAQCALLPQLVVDTCGCQGNEVETNPPTSKPTFDPTPDPTSPPTSKPSRIPSLEPTEKPTPNPSSKPTELPTFSPSRTPTRAPTTQPIMSVEEPSVIPTSSPSSYPTPSPTPKKTFAPTLVLSDTPTAIPTISPSIAASSEPSLAATLTPTLEPTTVPSNAPTGLPTQAPTNTQRPSSSPSGVPTISPTSSPSTIPTGVPSSSPTSFPSTSPTSSPTLPMQDNVVTVVMFFEGVDQILKTSEDQILYNAITKNYITKEFESLANEKSLTDISVGTIITEQEIIVPLQENIPTEAPIMNRALQEGKSVLKIVSDSSVKFRSPNADLKVHMLVGGAFNEEEERRVYLQKLRDLAGGAFVGSSLKVEVNGFEVVEVVKPPAPVEDTGGINIVPIIGGVAGGIAILLGAFLFYRRRRIPKEDITFATTQEKTTNERINTDILMEPQDEISTLGDPMYGAGMMMPGLEKDDTVAQSHISGDYEYSKNYQAARQRADTLQSSLGESKDSDVSSFAAFGRDSVFDDDVSFEQQFTEEEYRFEVVAPAGKLGMVIDTPSGGMPVVHAIKDTSILADQVMVGDRLISVDDEDTTGFTAMQVSKLISQKVHQPTRTLMFSRTKARK